jgi:hypothetical protein
MIFCLEWFYGAGSIESEQIRSKNMQKSIQSRTETDRDHLFISYASENSILAEWLTLKLTVEGFKVWCDRTKLLGGESYPLDIDKAIKESTFRVLALLSKNSIQKPNPVKERTIALSLGKERGIDDFVIPLNVDGLSPTDLNWMVSDLTFIPFYKGWAEGLTRLLKKLGQIGAPRDPKRGRESVAKWVTNEDSVLHEEERVWSNVLPITTIPPTIRRYYVGSEDELKRFRQSWPVYGEKNQVWTFALPDENNSFAERQVVDWSRRANVDALSTIDVVTYLLRRSLTLHCIARGLKLTDDRRYIFFPQNLVESDKIPYQRYDGKRVYTKAVGQRTFHSVERGAYKSTYHLAPIFRPLVRRFHSPCYEINMRLVWTDGQGVEEPNSNRKRRALTKTWWNYQWLAKNTAFISWLTGAQNEHTIFASKHGDVKIAGLPITASSPMGILEDALTATVTEEDETEVLEEETEVEHDLTDEDEPETEKGTVG